MSKNPQEIIAEKQKRIDDAVALQVPDRVPIMPSDSGFFVKCGGETWEDVFYDATGTKMLEAAKKTVRMMDYDAYFPPVIFAPGQTYDLLGFRQLKWAGAADPAQRVTMDGVYQFVEPGQGYPEMPAEEYDEFIDDPSFYMFSKHLPRIATLFEPLAKMPRLAMFASYINGLGQALPLIGTPPFQSMLESLSEAGRLNAQFNSGIPGCVGELMGEGHILAAGGFGYAPFDFIADFMRGTRGALTDMYRHPDKLKKAIERITPWILEWALYTAEPMRPLCNRVFIPIHKCAGNFMSEDQHKEFFWPSLREIIIGLIEHDFVPYIYTEGEFGERLETIRDVPPGKVIYHIETPLFKAKDVLGDVACIEGGLSGPLLNIGSVEEVRAETKKIIDYCGQDGGFIFGTELPMITAKPENVKAMVDTVKEYGIY